MSAENSGAPDGTGDPKKSDDEYKSKLTPEQYAIARKAGTEQAFSGKYWDEKTPGVYHCICCDAALFTSDTKYDSGSGWPSFFEEIREGAVSIKRDASHGMVREEAVCANCDAHLGHRFPDGPAPTGQRYCMNSASLDLKRSDDGA